MGKIKDIIFENWQYKLLALGFAIFFWYVVIGQQKSEITLEFPIEFQNVPENYVIINNPVRKVSVLLSGPSPIIKTLSKENLSFPVDLSKVKIGRNEIYLLPHMLKLPKKIKVKFINPSRLEIVIDKLETKQVPVIPTIIGKVKPGYKITSINVTPPVVSIVCISKELKNLDIVHTDEINVNGKKESFEISVPVEINLKYLKSISPQNVNVKIVISEDIVKKTFKNVKIKVKKDINLDNYSIEIFPKTVNITVSLNKIFEKIITKKDIEPYIEITSVQDGDYKINVNLPKNVKLEAVVPEEVSVKFLQRKRRGRK